MDKNLIYSITTISCLWEDFFWSSLPENIVITKENMFSGKLFLQISLEMVIGVIQAEGFQSSARCQVMSRVGASLSQVNMWKGTETPEWKLSAFLYIEALTCTNTAFPTSAVKDLRVWWMAGDGMIMKGNKVIFS